MDRVSSFRAFDVRLTSYVQSSESLELGDSFRERVLRYDPATCWINWLQVAELRQVVLQQVNRFRYISFFEIDIYLLNEKYITKIKKLHLKKYKISSSIN